MASKRLMRHLKRMRYAAVSHSAFVALASVLFVQSAVAEVETEPAKETVVTYEITVDISNARNQDGEMCIALFRDGRGYPDDLKGAVTRECIALDALPLRLQAPAGDYAIAVMHDENGDRKMNTGLMGIPKEGYGFSNNAGARFGPPAWKTAMFKLEADRNVSIELTYW